LEESLKRIQSQGGIFVYLLCDGRGAGLLHKVRGLELGRTQGLDTSDVYRLLGLKQDPREYERVAKVLHHLNADSIRLLTNNPRKVDGLRQHGISAMREPLEIIATVHSRPYLEAKKRKMGHLLTQFSDGPLK
jgi:GTP cyclohydrolase II